MRCYLTEIDDDFDPTIDIALGPWCLSSIKQAEQVKMPRAYDRKEIFELHKVLFNLSYYLLNKDINHLPFEIRKIHYLHLQKDYLFFVFFAFSKYRLIRNMLKESSIELIEFEDVQYKLPSNDHFDVYFTSRSAGLLSCEIIKYIVPKDKLKLFTRKLATETTKYTVSSRNGSFLEKIKTRLNYFHKVNGVKFPLGVALSALYFLRNFFAINKKEKKMYAPKIEFNFELNEFIDIFNAISDKFINKKIEENFPKLSSFSLIIENPNFIYDGKMSLKYSEMISKNRTNLIVMQHGSHYATAKKHFLREIEYEWGKFLSWGKNTQSYLKRSNKIVNLPSPYLGFIADKYVCNQQDTVLWVTGVHFKNGDGLEYYDGGTALEYMKKKRVLWHALNEGVSKSIFFKHLPLYSETFPDIMLDLIPKERQICGGSIVPYMLDSKFILLDYYGTPFYEAMSMNVPIILALLEGVPFFTKEAFELFQKFEKVGVVYRSIEIASEFLNQTNDMDIGKWWNDEKIQCIRKEFLEKYANNKPYFWRWAKAIWNREI